MSTQAAVNNANTDAYHRLEVSELERAARVARYKEQRRRQLESQFGTTSHINNNSGHAATSSASSISSTSVAMVNTSGTAAVRKRYISRTRNNLVTTTTAVTDEATSSSGGNVITIATASTTTATTPNGSTAGTGPPPPNSNHHDLQYIVRSTRTSLLRTAAATATAQTYVTLDSPPHRERGSSSVAPNGNHHVGGLGGSVTISRYQHHQPPPQHHQIVVSTSDSQAKKLAAQSTRLADIFTTSSTRRLSTDKDKSSKRKSNLNRSLNSEEVPSPYDNLANNQRRRHLAPLCGQMNPTVVSHATSPTNYCLQPLNSGKILNADDDLIPLKANVQRKQSELSIHMENARRSLSINPYAPKEKRNSTHSASSSPRSKPDHANKKSSDTEFSSATISDRENKYISSRRVSSGSQKDTLKRKITNSSPKLLKTDSSKQFTSENSTKRPSSTFLTSDLSKSNSSRHRSSSDTLSSFLNSHKIKSDSDKSDRKKSSRESSSSSHYSTKDSSSNSGKAVKKSTSKKHLIQDENDIKNINETVVRTKSKTHEISRRMDSLTQLTRNTLARVEKLAARSNKNTKRNTVSNDENGAKPKKDLQLVNKVVSVNNSNSTENVKINRPQQVDVDDKLDNLLLNGAQINVPDSQNKYNNENSPPSTSSKAEVNSILKKKSIEDSAIIQPSTSNEKVDKKFEDDIIIIEHNTPSESRRSSILKYPTESNLQTVQSQQSSVTIPVSILKRKTSQDESGNSSLNTLSYAHCSSAPVTFSPSVVDPPSSRRRQGILKKRRSLDESEVMRRRSCSPDITIVEGTSTEFRPILKQRRSSLEEVRVGSPEPQGILKRKSNRADGESSVEDRSMIGSPEPQSILKRKSGSSSGGSNGSQHVSIATAVILAAAGGAEIVCDTTNENVKPILKKKSISEESTNVLDNHEITVPKPILKKKCSTDTDDYDDKPKKTILKTTRNQNYQDSNDTDMQIKSKLRNRSSESVFDGNSSPIRKIINTRTNEASEMVRPILKQSCSRESSPRPRLSFCDETNNLISETKMTSPVFEHVTLRRPPSTSPIFRSRSNGSEYDEVYRKRRSLHIGENDRLSAELNTRRRQSMSDMRDSYDNSPSNSMSVAERVLRMESFLAQEQKADTLTGAVPKRRSSLRPFDIERINKSQSPSVNREASSPTKLTNSILLEPSQTCSQNGEPLTNTIPHPVVDQDTSQSTSFDLTLSSDLASENSQRSLSQINEKSIDSGIVLLTETKMSETDEETHARRASSDFSCQDETVTSTTPVLDEEDDIATRHRFPSPDVDVPRRNSVSSRAAAFNKQFEEQLKTQQNEPQRRATNEGVERFKHRKSMRSSYESSRFSTQPVTLDEVQEAVKQNQTHAEDIDENDPSKLTLAERVKLFNKKIMEPSKPPNLPLGPPPTRKRISRFKTQPITTDEVEKAQQKINPLVASFVKSPEPGELGGLTMQQAKEKIHQHAARMLTNEVKGILKSRSFISPIGTCDTTPMSINNSEIITKSPPLKSVLKKDSFDKSDSSSCTSSTQPQLRSILKSESPSSYSDTNQTDIRKSPLKYRYSGGHNELLNNSEASDSGDQASAINSASCYETHNKRIDEIVSHSSSTSEGESSGGREVKSIIKNELHMRRRPVATSKYQYADKKYSYNKTSPTYITDEKDDLLSSDEHKSKIKIISNKYVGDVDDDDDDEEENEDNVTTQSAFYKTYTTSTTTTATLIPTNAATTATPLKPAPRTPSDESDETSSDEHDDFKGVASSRKLTESPQCSRTTPRVDMPADASDVPDNVISGVSPPISIAERRAALEHAGNNDWKRRITPVNKSTKDEIKTVLTAVHKVDEVSKQEDKSEVVTTSVLQDRVYKLETASQEWKRRVEQSDAIKFTVAGRMGHKDDLIPISPSLPNIPLNGSKIKRAPKPTRFKTKDTENFSSDFPLKRSISVPGAGEGDNDSVSKVSKVVVPRIDDETFTSFFSSVTDQQTHENIELTNEDLDVVSRSTQQQLLGQRRNIMVQRKHRTSRNPLKNLSSRIEIKTEYTEIKTSTVEKEFHNVQVEKLAKSSNLAITALAGLASKEDFTAISLKKTNNTANSTTFSMLPYNDLTLIHVKGRRHVQARIVEPVASSINRGDNYVLITPKHVFNYQGAYSNIIEQSRAAEIAATSALERNTQVITINEEKMTCSQKLLEEFWKSLGHTDTKKPPPVIDAGHPDEDEIYESKIIETNMVYILENDELVPYKEYWGCIPKIEMLDPSKILVFDFGTELYVWNGKNSSLDRRQTAVKLVKELWKTGFDYSDCDICPINITQMLGAQQTVKNLPKKSNSRPNWALLAKINQNMEPVLFREKFLDWPDYSRVIKIKEDNTDKSSNIIIKPIDVSKMLAPNTNYPDLVLEGSHLGRGKTYFDAETNRYYEIQTLAVSKWHVQEFEYYELKEQSYNHFYSGDSYIIRWQYMITVKGRELSGKPSKHFLAGRDRCAYFCWQGKNASLNEKGAAALLTVELDHEKGPQIRVTEGSETPAFLSLFDGSMMIHSGKREDPKTKSWRLYFCRGDAENEAFLTEVPCNMRQLRSRASMIFINEQKGMVIIWHGAKSLNHTKDIARSAAKKIINNTSTDLQFDQLPSISEVSEGEETSELLEVLGVSNGRQLYASLLKSSVTYDETPRLFHFTSVSGVFDVNEVLCPHRSEDKSVVTPYPFLQSDLYSASQPSIFLFDNKDKLWLWQGWWPNVTEDSDRDSPTNLSNQTGSGATRWQEERRAAMQTTINYWKEKYAARINEDNLEKAEFECPAFLVWAGLEPLEFTNLFPTWSNRDDIAEINIQDGRKPGEILSLNSELQRLTCCTYPPAVLLQRPLPDGVDPKRLEEYLSPAHFTHMFKGLTKEEFYKLPVWKQINLKKEYGLF